jgi:hypothetical protein
VEGESHLSPERVEEERQKRMERESRGLNVKGQGSDRKREEERDSVFSGVEWRKRERMGNLMRGEEIIWDQM